MARKDDITLLKEPRRLSEGKVSVREKLQRDKDGRQYREPPKWVLSVNITSYYKDGTSKSSTKTKIMSRIPCSQRRDGTWKGKQKAKEALSEWKADLQRDIDAEWESARNPVDPESERVRGLSVRDFVTEYIDRQLRRGDIEASTAHCWHSLTRHFDFFTCPVGDVGVRELDSFQEYMLTARRDGGRLAYSSRLKVWQLLKRAFKSAVRRNLLDANPLDKFDAPSRGIEPKPKPKPLTRESLSKLDAWLEDQEYDRDRVAFELCLRTGMRRGEVAALRWCDVNLDNDVIVIRHAVGTASDKSYLKETKTRQERPIHISPKIHDLLEGRRRFMQELCEYFGTDLTDSHYVIGTPDGECAHPMALTHSWVNLSKKLDLKDVNGNRAVLHSLRHTWISYARAYGISDAVTQSVVGHTDITTTDGYTGALPESLRQAMELMDSIL